ncbi:MAG: potassium transporter [Deltaproteobacteria bacterium]|nr:potassium transporter [Deltaproteobacteria bacterium]
MSEQSKSDKFKKIWILGAGKFGQLALERIIRHLPEVEITLVDNRVQETAAKGVTVVCKEGISWLADNMQREETADMIIPSLPVHMVAEWMKLKSSANYGVSAVPLPTHLVARLPNPIKNGDSQLYLSHADFLCPDNCGEPELFCTSTGKERAEDMFHLLANIDESPYIPFVVRSYQLFPGVGAIYPEDMWSLLDRVHNFLNKPLLIATACRCHGVLDGLQFRAKRS